MLKKRLAAVLIIRSGWVVQSFGFSRHLPVGRPGIAVEYLNRWGADEIICLDMTASPQGRGPDFEAVAAYARHSQCPLTVGGGIRSLHDVERLIAVGADKVAVNTALDKASLVADAAGMFGSQAVVASIDARRVGAGYEVFRNGGRQPTGLSPAQAAQRAVAAGAGEILLTSIDRDGSGQGYDLELAGSVIQAVAAPVLLCGGAGGPAHLLDGARAGASAVCAANMFHHCEHSITLAKRGLLDLGLAVRLETNFDYAGVALAPDGRLRKRDDHSLEAMRFVRVVEETI